jgi:hypothetical protein
VLEYVRRFLDGTPLSIKGLNRSDLPPSTAAQTFVTPTGVAAEFVRLTADAVLDLAADFGYDPTEEVVLVNGLTVRYGHPYADANNGIAFTLSVGGSQSTVSSSVPPIVGAAELLQWLAGFTWWFDGDDLNVQPGNPAVKATHRQPRIYQMVPKAGLLTMELAGPALSAPTGSGMRVPGGLLYRRTVQGQVATLILDGGDVVTRMMPFPNTVAAPDELIAEASQLVVHRA